MSVYLCCSEGLSRRNLDLLQSLAQVIDSLHGPWIVAADFNMSPEVLRSSGWLNLVHGRVVAPSAPTCGCNVYDFFVVSETLGSAIVGIALINDAGFFPHWPVRLFSRDDFAVRASVC